MDSIVPGEDPWSQIPIEIACQIIGRTNDLDDIVAYRRTSQTFERLARTCIRQVDSRRKIILPLSYFAGFDNLQIVSDNIILEATPEDLNLLRRLPALRAANFYIGDFNEETVDSFGEISVAILQQLQLDQKLPRVNFRIVGLYETKFEHLERRPVVIGLIIQGNRFITIVLDPSVAQMVSRVFPQLQYVQLPKGEGFSQYRLMSQNLREFLRVGEFGLVDPNRPPSESNPSLSLYLRRLADSGLVNSFSVGDIFWTYIFNNRLAVGTVITADELINRLFREDIIRHNQELGPGREPVDPDTFSYSYLSILAAQNIEPRSIEDITNYDVPTPLTDEESATIKRTVDTARRNRDRLQQANSRAVRQGQPPLQFYLPDGTTRTL